MLAPKVREFIRREDAQGMVEYILIIAVVALVVIAGVRLFGDKLKALFERKADEIGNM